MRDFITIFTQQIASLDYCANPATRKVHPGPRGAVPKDGLPCPSLSCFQFAAENNNGTESSALLRAHSPALAASITASRCSSVRRFLKTFSLLLQKAKPKPGLTGRGKREEAGDAITAELWGLVHSGCPWGGCGLRQVFADGSACAGSLSRFDHSLNL